MIVGILLALQIDNWNKDREYDIQEKIYLERQISENVLDTKQSRDVCNHK